MIMLLNSHQHYNIPRISLYSICTLYTVHAPFRCKHHQLCKMDGIFELFGPYPGWKLAFLSDFGVVESASDRNSGPFEEIIRTLETDLCARLAGHRSVFSFLLCFFYFLLDLTGCLLNQHCVAEPFLSALGSEIKKATIRPYLILESLGKDIKIIKRQK